MNRMPIHLTAFVRHLLLSMAIVLSGLGGCGGGGGGGGGGSNNLTPTPPATNQSPTANFTLNVTTGNAPLVISVDASTSSDADGSLEQFIWDFGGTGGIGQVAQHTFTDAGTFIISLTVTDDDGATASASRTVTVTDSAVTATLSGTVNILSSSVVDADLNDRLTIGTPNNDFAQAQSIPTPATLGGFINRPNTGEPTGNLFSTGDPADFYQASFAGGETILLDIAEQSADLDLALFDLNENLIDASLGITNTESLEVVSAGTYYVRVTAVAGASNYVLSVGQLNTATAIQSMNRSPSRLSDPFIPGELIVKHQNSRTQLTTPSYTLAIQNAPAQQVNRANNNRQVTEGLQVEARPRLYQVADRATQTPQDDNLMKMSAEQKLRWHTLMALKEIQVDSGVAFAEPNLWRHPTATPNDDFFTSQWHYPAINLPIAWDTTTGSADVIVAVVDTGVLLAHPDLSNKLVPGYDFISDASRAQDGDGIDANPDDPGDRNLGGSSSFHGTHVAGTIAAETNNDEGVSGVAWESRIMPMRALGDGGGSTFDIIQAVRFAAGLDNNSGTLPAQRADLINLSLGGTFSSQSEQATYTEAIQAGVIIVASAGNDGSTLPSYPGAYDGVINVSATTITNNIAGYSNTGSSIDVAAPGGSTVTDLNGDGIGDGVISTMGDDSGSAIEFGYAALSGTSMAAPHVAGVLALMKAIYPDLTPAQVNAALAAGDLTDDLGATGRDDEYGHGLINAQKAVLAATALANGQGTDPGPILVSSASTLNFGGFIDTLTLTLSNIGTGDINIQNITSNEPWVTIDPPSEDLGEYQISIQRDGLADGAYLATLTIESDANDLNVTLIMQVASLNASADAGLHYVILVDSNNDTVLPAVLVTATNGTYPFTIQNVPAGEYRLFAGSDYDDDSKLCDAGEACGAYPTLEDPAFIAINTDRNGLDFESGFRINLNVSSTGAQNQNEQNGNPNQSPEGISFTKESMP